MRPGVSTVAAFLLIVLSAIGLLAFGFVTSGRSVRDAAAATEAATTKGALATARHYAEEVAKPGFLSRLPLETGFEFVASILVVPADLGRLTPSLEDVADLSLTVTDGLREAERLEFATGDPEAAASLLRSLAADVETHSPATLPRVLLPLAWNAHRRGDVGERERILERLTQPPPEDLRSRVALLSLLAASGRSLPNWTGATIRRLPGDLATGLFERLSAGDSGASEVWRRDYAVAVAHRRTLARVQAMREAIIGQREFSVQTVDGDLLIWHPVADGAGRGALAPVEAVILALASGDDGSDWAGGLVAAAQAPPTAIPVAGGLAVIPEKPPAAGRWSGPWFPAVTLIALLVLLGLGVSVVLRAARQATLAARTRADFLAGITHELKTPLASIRLLSEMLEDGRVASEDKRHEYHRMLSAESGRLAMLIENVLDLGRMERGERAYDMRTHDLNHVVHDALALFGPLARRDGLAVASRLAGRPMTCRVDRGAIVQALLSVLDNARKYAILGKRIEVSTAADGADVLVHVRDFGPGIAPAERERIFERFQRGTSAKDSASGGVGLGLYLAREVARAHGGEMTVEDAPDGGEGVMFTLRIPLTMETVES